MIDSMTTRSFAPSTSTRHRADADTAHDCSTEPATRPAALGRLVHDLRNPLNTLTMNLELMSLVNGDPVPGDDFGDGLAAMERAVEELERGLARIEAHAESIGNVDPSN